jgi:5-methylthioadenosine/S-adenosylhomocysteine deaminase
MPGLGAPATSRLLAHGVRPSLSIDTEISVAGDMFNVMRAAIAAHGLCVTLQPETYESLPALTAADLLEFATIRGAEACGLAHKTGSITPGKDADLIIIDVSGASTLPANDLAGSIVGAGHNGVVRTVMVGGTVVKHDGRLTGIDLDQLRQQAEISRDRLFATPLADA